jgi:hypothetical protein
VTFTPHDGPTQTTEVQAGGGYLSQSPPVLFFGGAGQGHADVEIRWPDGEVTRSSLAPGSDPIVLDHPARAAKVAAEPATPSSTEDE